MFAGWIGRDNGLGAACAEPMTQLAGIIGSIGEKALRTGDRIKELVSRDEVVSIAGRDLEGDGSTAIIRQGMDFGRAPPARAADGAPEGPPFAPAAERFALTWLESMAIVPTLPVEPVSA